MRVKTVRALLVCLILGLGILFLVKRAGDETDVLSREGDERVTSLQEREQTLVTLLAAVQVERSNGNHVKAARFLNRAGRLQLLLTLPDEALKTYQNALDTVTDQDPPTKIASLNGLAAGYTSLKRCPDAERAANQAIELSDQTQNVAGKAQALLTLSECQSEQNQLKALKTAQDALELWKSVNNKWGIGKTYSAIGVYQLTLQNLTESAESHQAALAIWRELNIPYEEAQALINLGFIEYRKAEWQNAISFFLQAQRLLDPKAYPYEMGQITTTLGEIFTETGSTDSALTNLGHAAEHFGQTKDPLALAVVSLDTGRVYHMTGRYSEAIATLNQTIANAEKINSPNLIGMCHELLGETYVSLNDPATALVHLQMAVDLFTQTSRIMEVARVQARMGQVYGMEKKVKEAEDYYSGALTTFRSLSDRLNESATLYALGKLKLDQEDLDAAEQYLRQSIDVTEDIRRTPTTTDLTAAFSATIIERYQRYIDCLMRKKKAGSSQDVAVAAFELSEQARARSLKELLQATQTNLIADPQLAQQEQSLRQSIRSKEDYKMTLLSTKYDPQELAKLDAELAQLERQYTELVDAVGQQFSAYGQLRRAQSWDLRRIQEQVIRDDDTALLEYVIGEDRSYAWAVTRNDIVSYELAPEIAITDAAQKVYALLSNPPSAKSDAQLVQATDELSKLVLAPLSGALSRRRIIVVADGVLNYIPFQMLPTTAGNSERLIDRHEVINAPSASILGELREETTRRQPRAKVLAAFGNPVFMANYEQTKGGTAGAVRDIRLEADTIDPAKIQPLFYTTRELNNLFEVAGKETLMLTGFDATREMLNSIDLTEYAILHFATHGVLDPKKPENSGLYLSMLDREAKPLNGFIRLQDVYALKARVDLVVLSACRTGLGKDVKGEGLIGLTRGFMYAGASSAVASLWSVDDEATAELMKYFYANMLQKNMTPAAALREAQNSVRSDPRWSSPYYWAAFTFQGDYDLRISTAPGQPANYKTLVIGSIAGLLLLTLLLGIAWKVFSRKATKTQS